MLGYFWIFISMSLSIGLYKLEISKRVIDEEYEYIKRHRAFGNLTKYLTIRLCHNKWLILTRNSV